MLLQLSYMDGLVERLTVVPTDDMLSMTKKFAGSSVLNGLRAIGTPVTAELRVRPGRPDREVAS